MDVFKFAFETVVVGLLAVPWLLILIDLLVPGSLTNGHENGSALLASVPESIRQPAVSAVLFAVIYVVGSAVSPLAQDALDDDDLAIVGLPSARGIRQTVYRKHHEWPSDTAKWLPHEGSYLKDLWHRMLKTRLARRIFKGFAVLAALGVLGVGALLGAFWLERRTEITLPAPTGSFPVGRAIYDWADDTKLDTLAPVPGTKRELLVWIWYPAATSESAARDDYVPGYMRAALGTGGLLGLLTRDVAKVHGHSIRNPDVSPRQQTYPVVIMRAGASAEVCNYASLAEDLASHGYVVVGFDAPYRTFAVVFPDGRVMRRTPENNAELCEDQALAQRAGCVNKVLTAWTADIAFVLDRLERWNTADSSGKFAGRLDMTRVGVFGHSFGGATAAQILSRRFQVQGRYRFGRCSVRQRRSGGSPSAVPVRPERPNPFIGHGDPTHLGRYPIDLRWSAAGWAAAYRDSWRKSFPV